MACTLVAAAAASIVMPTTAVAQVLNGGFETGVPNNAINVVIAGSFIDAPGHWKVASGNVNTGTGPAGTSCRVAGTKCVDLNGENPGSIEQQLQPIPSGQLCTVQFYMSRHKNLNTASMRALINGTQVANFTHSTPGVVDLDGKWDARSFTFVSTASNKLGFETLMPGAAGPQIDDVTIACRDGGRPPLGDATLPVDMGTPLLVNAAALEKPCCPPWTADRLTDRMYYQSAGGIGAGYTLRFTPNTVLNTQLSTYVAYAQSLNGATGLIIDFSLFDAGVNSTPSAGGSAISTGSATWTASGLSGAPNFFAAGAMQVNKWYTVKTHVHFVGSGASFDENCPDVEMSVRVQVRSAAAGGDGRTVLQVRGKGGRLTERQISASARP